MSALASRRLDVAPARVRTRATALPCLKASLKCRVAAHITATRFATAPRLPNPGPVTIAVREPGRLGRVTITLDLDTTYPAGRCRMLQTKRWPRGEWRAE